MTQFDEVLEDSAASIRRLLRGFVIALLVLAFGIGGWAFAARVESAIIATGAFQVKSNAQAVQHLEGGVIGAILVSEGDEVQRGQVLVRLDGASIAAERAILQRQRVDLMVERARLRAERDGDAVLPRIELLDLDPELSATVRSAAALQQTMLTARVAARDSKISQLEQQLRQVGNEIGGLDRLRAARLEEAARIGEELEALEALDKRRLIAKSRLRSVQREAARIKGDIGDIDARIASAQSQVVELQLRIDEIERDRASETLAELQQVEALLAETEERLGAAEDRQRRLEIRAPRSGLIHEVQAHTVGGVAAPGAELMSIVPLDDPLIISARIATNEVDQVRIGQPAIVKISAFSARNTPELNAEVVGVSADQKEDPRTGEPYFEARVAIIADEMHKLGEHRLTPGLPAEVFIRGNTRRVIDYLTKPLTDQVSHAFREE